MRSCCLQFRHGTDVYAHACWFSCALHHLAGGGIRIRVVTSNLPFDEWTSVFGNQRLSGAPLDRLTHYVHILEMNGESYRLKQSKARRQKEPQSATEQLVDPETVEISPT